MINSTELNKNSWAAGFFDGEGCTSFENYNIRISIRQKNREVLDKFQRIVACGTVRGPYFSTTSYDETKTYVFYDFFASSILDVIKIIRLLWPELSQQKRKQFKKCYLLYKLKQKNLKKKRISMATKIAVKTYYLESKQSIKTVAKKFSLNYNTTAYIIYDSRITVND